jgi:alpha/beta superfamily hydrolase
LIDNEREIKIGADAIHAIHHRAGGGRFAAVAPPLFEESARLRKVLVNLSRFLCGEGIDVVRFDYYGTGYSPGRYEDVTLERAGRDLADTIAYCRDHGATRLDLIGVRFGGYLALGELENPLLSRIVAWEPVVDPAAYIREVLRSEVATQMLIYGEVRRDRDRLVEAIRADGRLYVEGYCICRDLYDQLAGGRVLTPEAVSRSTHKAALLYWQTRREQKRWSGGGCRSRWVDGVRFAFNHIRHLDPRSEPLYRQTLEDLTTDG